MYMSFLNKLEIYNCKQGQRENIMKGQIKTSLKILKYEQSLNSF